MQVFIVTITHYDYNSHEEYEEIESVHANNQSAQLALINTYIHLVDSPIGDLIKAIINGNGLDNAMIALSAHHSDFATKIAKHLADPMHDTTHKIIIKVLELIDDTDEYPIVGIEKYDILDMSNDPMAKKLFLE